MPPILLKFKLLLKPYLNKITPAAPPLIAFLASVVRADMLNLVVSSSDTYDCKPDQILAPSECCTNHFVVVAIQDEDAS